MKYALDSNLYIDATRNTTVAEGLKRLMAAGLPSIYLIAVVMQELRAGARSSAQIEVLEKAVFAPFETRQRVIAPSVRAFKESGRILTDISIKDKVDIRSLGPSFINDVLIAASCREAGITLITHDQDFQRIIPHLRGFRFIPPPFNAIPPSL